MTKTKINTNFFTGIKVLNLSNSFRNKYVCRLTGQIDKMNLLRKITLGKKWAKLLVLYDLFFYELNSQSRDLATGSTDQLTLFKPGGQIMHIIALSLDLPSLALLKRKKPKLNIAETTKFF